jgi:nucleotide-binding universal stress UspA family protein
VESFADAFNLKTGAKSALSQAIPKASYDWSDIKPSILLGNVEQEILMAAVKTKADLIVLGAHRGMRRSSRFWDKIVEGVIRQADCPVLTVFPCEQ